MTLVAPGGQPPRRKGSSLNPLEARKQQLSAGIEELKAQRKQEKREAARQQRLKQKQLQNGWDETTPEVYSASDSSDTAVNTPATTIPPEYEEEYEDPPPIFGGYQPPGRLVLFELIAFVLLTYLLMSNPAAGSMSAISGDSKGGVGLLSQSAPCFRRPT